MAGDVDYERPELTPKSCTGIQPVVLATVQPDVNGRLITWKRCGNLRGASSAAVQSAGVPNNDVAEP